jgi:hypothetical protein
MTTPPKFVYTKNTYQLQILKRLLAGRTVVTGWPSYSHNLFNGALYTYTFKRQLINIYIVFNPVHNTIKYRGSSIDNDLTVPALDAWLNTRVPFKVVGSLEQIPQILKYLGGKEKQINWSTCPNEPQILKIWTNIKTQIQKQNNET